MVSPVPLGTVSRALAVILGRCRSPTVLFLPVLCRDLRLVISQRALDLYIYAADPFLISHVFNEKQYLRKGER